MADAARRDIVGPFNRQLAAHHLRISQNVYILGVVTMRTRDSILISLLAATDAAWLPSRESHGVKINSRVTSVYEARKRFREAGVPWPDENR